MTAFNKDLTVQDILRAGATGLRELVPESQLPAVLVAYSNSLDTTFKVAAGLATAACITAFAAEWKSVKKDVKSSNNEINS